MHYTKSLLEAYDKAESEFRKTIYDHIQTNILLYIYS